MNFFLSLIQKVEYATNHHFQGIVLLSYCLIALLSCIVGYCISFFKKKRNLFQSLLFGFAHCVENDRHILPFSSVGRECSVTSFEDYILQYHPVVLVSCFNLLQSFLTHPNDAKVMLLSHDMVALPAYA
jgi:hypothetical protein